MIKQEQVERVLQEQIRPVLAVHGGNVEIRSLEGNVLWLKLLGQCANCISGKQPTQQLIRDTLSAAIPGLETVEFDESVSRELLDMARRILNHEEADA